MKQFLKSTLLLLALLLPATATAHDFEVNGIYYNILNDNEVEVTFKGSYVYQYQDEYIGYVTIPPTVTYYGTTYSVTSVGNYAFSVCSSLTGVTIPNSVTSIGTAAFNECSCLSIVNIPNSVTSIGNRAFDSCISLTSITIPNSVTTIGISAFWGCTSLASIDIPGSVTSIDYRAFAECSGLAEITVASDNPKYDSRENCNAIIETATNTFLIGCKNSFIPSTITTIGDYAFYRTYGLSSIIIPNSVTSIGQRAFLYCTDLAAVTIPNTITEIGVWAFTGSSLTSVTIPSSVTYIGFGAFTGSPSMTTITVASDNPVYDSRDNSNAIIETTTNTLITGCKNTSIPSSVKYIGKYAFYSCTSLASFTIPKSIISIGDYAFSDCSGLTSLTIPSTIDSIGYRSFANCTILSNVYCYINDPSTISMGNEVFMGSSAYNDRTLHVPVGSLEAYSEDTKWSRYFGTIVDDPLTGDVDADGRTSIADVTELIDMLLRGDVGVEDNPAADVNGNGIINIADVVELIDQLLN